MPIQVLVLNDLGFIDREFFDFDPDQSGGGASFPPGGTTGQALVKASTANGDVVWATITGGGGGTYEAVSPPQSWLFPGAVSVRQHAAQITTPAFGTVELVGASLVVRAVGSGSTNTGETRVRFTVNDSPAGEITLATGSLKTTGFYKTNPSEPAKRIFASLANLAPDSSIACEIIGIPNSSVKPQNLTVNLFWRWSE